MLNTRSERARRCVFCHAALPQNEAVEHFPVGRRIAFDPRRGRLWAVCPSCHRWNLAPFDERWEALEELEKTRRDLGRVLSSTENISLIRAPGIELVRVGEARLPEEAWWRYGAEMTRRRTRYRAMRWIERGSLVAATMATGGFFWMFGGNGLNRLSRWRKFGTVAWQGRAACVACGAPLEHLTFRRTRYLHLSRDTQGDPALHLQCMSCRRRGMVGEHQIEGAPADHVLRRVMAYHHYHGASESRVHRATRYIDQLGSPHAVTTELTRSGIRLDKLFDRDRRTQAIALEISLNDETERRLLQMELAELEARWKEAEKIAEIADGLLTPTPTGRGVAGEPG